MQLFGDQKLAVDECADALELSKRVVVVVKYVHQSILTFLAFHCHHIELRGKGGGG